MPLLRDIQGRFRRRRMGELWDRFGLSVDTRVLDVGGLPANWSLAPGVPRLVLLNISFPADEMKGSFPWVIADGRFLPFVDEAFDLVYSNAVIEHVGSIGDQQRFADECRRVGKRYYVQTPNRRFPVELHLMRPFVHWLPRGAQALVLRGRYPWYLREIRLLSAEEMRRLFPDGVLWRERFLGMTKSLIAVSSAPGPDQRVRRRSSGAISTAGAAGPGSGSRGCP